MVYLTSNLHGLGKARGAGRDDKVLLEGEFVPRMAASVDNIEAWYGHGVLGFGVTGEFGVVGIKGELVGGGTGLGAG